MIKQFRSGDIEIKIDYDKCTGIGKCVEECPVDIFELEKGKAVAKNIEECIECCICIDASKWGDRA